MLMNWSKGNIKFYTRQVDIARKAAYDGNLVTVVKLKSVFYPSHRMNG